MFRVYPKQINDKIYLSVLLEKYLEALENSPMQVRLKALSWDAQIPESIFRRLSNLHRRPEDMPHIEASDFHILFSNIMFRFPTVKIWRTPKGEFFFEM